MVVWGGVSSQGVMKLQLKDRYLHIDVSIIDSITFREIKRDWCADKKLNQNIKELFIPEIDKYGEGCYISSFSCTEDGFRLFICDRNDEVVLYAKEDRKAFTNDYYKYNSITPVLDYKNNEQMGFCFFYPNDGGYSNSGIKYKVSYDIISELNNNPRISNTLNSEQIVLLGDSKYGNYWSNPLPDMLMGLSGCYVANLGFGGCRMSWRSNMGDEPYDAFSFSSICEALATRNFSRQINSTLDQYQYMINNMINLDLSKPTTILVNYGTNDITGNTPIGSLQDVENVDIDRIDRSTYIGAIYYGVYVLLNKYPHIKIIFLSPDFRLINGISIEDYKNILGMSVFDYYNEEENICQFLGCRFVDSYHLNFRNDRVINEYTTDGTHFNGKGFSKYARFLYDVWFYDN